MRLLRLRVHGIRRNGLQIAAIVLLVLRRWFYRHWDLRSHIWRAVAAVRIAVGLRRLLMVVRDKLSITVVAMEQTHGDLYLSIRSSGGSAVWPCRAWRLEITSKQTMFLALHHDSHRYRLPFTGHTLLKYAARRMTVSTEAGRWIIAP